MATVFIDELQVVSEIIYRAFEFPLLHTCIWLSIKTVNFDDIYIQSLDTVLSL